MSDSNSYVFFERQDVLDAYLAASPWVTDFAKTPFAMAPADFATTLVENMLSSGGIAWRGDRLIASTPHAATTPTWSRSPVTPSEW